MLRLLLAFSFSAAGACAHGPETPLTQAAARNDVTALRSLLDSGLKANERSDAWTPLIWAARSGSVEALKVDLPGDFRTS
ncbi:MAG: ankyrin repeat domain-containing protein [Acidimicrobiia bacterium]